MKRWCAHLLMLLVMVSLMAMPDLAVACPAGPSCAAKACCGSCCPCPTGPVCETQAAPVQDRAISQAQPVPTPVSMLLYSLSEAKDQMPVSVTLAAKDIKSPPLALGSPPQAKLRVWLL